LVACADAASDSDAEASGDSSGSGSGSASADDADDGGESPDDDDDTAPDDGGTDASDDANDDDDDDTAADGDSSDDDGGESTTASGIDPPFTVSNAADFGELAPTGLVLGPPNGTFDTDEDCTEDAPLGVCEAVATTTVDACVCRADEIVIGDLTVVGTRALVLLAWTSVEVVGVLDVGGHDGEPGPGAWMAYAEEAPFSAGGLGGSYGSFGGNDAAEPYGEAELVPLVGGMNGQDGCGATDGGGAGGALQISAGERIVVAGIVDAGGGGGAGGFPSDTCNGGAGGGSGGAILLESIEVEIYGEIAANGGGAGSGGTTSYFGHAGDDALGVERADGAASQSEESCALGNTVFSGWGGDGATADASAGDGGPTDSETICFTSIYAGEGGGGGGVGRVRVNTDDGAQGCICTGDFSPETTFGDVLR
jgi:hypothetical protein